MSNIDDAFSVGKLSLDDSVLIVPGTVDPTIGVGYEAPIGSLYLRTNGNLYQKNNTADVDWALLASNVTTNRVQTVYVGKHGNDSNTGFTPERAKLTFGAAITTASSLIPTTSNRISIICDDGGTYTESFTVPSWILIKAPNTTFVGNIILSDNSELVFQEISATTGSVISKVSGTATAWVSGEKVQATGLANSIVNGSTTSILIVRVRQVYVENGTGILDNSTGYGHVHVDIEDIYITGVGTAIDRQTNTGIIVGRISHILETGGGIGNGIALDVTNGNVSLNIGSINCKTAYSVAGIGTLNLIVNYINPAADRIQLSGNATVNVVEADSFRWKYQNSNFNARRMEFVSIDTSANPVTMYLPNPASSGDSVTFQDALNTFTTNNLTVDALSGGLIDDGASGSQTIQIQLSGTNGIFIYNGILSKWSFSHIQEEVAFSPDNVIYVTKNGSDTIGDGSFSKPYLTIKKGAIQALVVASSSNPTTVKVLDGVYDEINPITITNTNSQYVQIQGSESASTIIQPTINGQPLFILTSPTSTDGPTLSRMTPRGRTNGGVDYSTIAGSELVRVQGDGFFFLDDIFTEDGYVGVSGGNGIVTSYQRIRWTNGASQRNTIGTRMVGSNTLLDADIVRFRQNGTAVAQTTGSRVELNNYEILGDVAAPVGTGIDISDNSTFFSNGGNIRGLSLGLNAKGTSQTTILATIFASNTTEFNQVNATASIIIQGDLSKTKQLITDGALVSLNYIDVDTFDYIVGNADATGNPGKEFRVRNFDGRVFIGDNATNANGVTNTVGGSRSINLIDSNGNMRIWRFTGAAAEDPSIEWVKGINPAIDDGEGDAPIIGIIAGTDTITISVSGAEYNDPLNPTPGIDRTTLVSRAFYAGAQFRVNGTVSNNANYVVSSATYNSGPQTISIIVTTNITVSEGAGGTIVFGGGAGRPTGVSTYVGNPGAAVAAGTGNVHWDMFLQESDYCVIRHRTGGGGGIANEKVRIYPDHTEWLGATTYGDGDAATMLYLQTVPTAVNYLQINNAATGNGPEMQAIGTNANINVEMIPKGTGTVTVPVGYDTNTTAQSLITKQYVDNNIPIFGTHFQEVASLGITTITTIGFQQKLNLTTASVPAGTYRVGWSFQFNHDDITSDAIIRVQLDNATDLTLVEEEQTDSSGTFGTTGTDQQRSAAGFAYVVLTSGVHTVDIDLASSVAGVNTSVWNARLEIWRVI